MPDPPGCSGVARQRLGVEARGLPGGHSPFLGRPAALVDPLVEVTAATGAPTA